MRVNIPTAGLYFVQLIFFLYKGRKRLVHVGKKGGKYVIVEGNKRYLKPKTTKAKISKGKPVKRKPTKAKPVKKKPAKRKPGKRKTQKPKTLMNYFKMTGGEELDLCNHLGLESYKIQTGKLGNYVIDKTNPEAWEKLPFRAYATAKKETEGTTLENAIENETFLRQVSEAVQRLQNKKEQNLAKQQQTQGNQGQVYTKTQQSRNLARQQETKARQQATVNALVSQQRGQKAQRQNEQVQTMRKNGTMYNKNTRFYLSSSEDSSDSDGSNSDSSVSTQPPSGMSRKQFLASTRYVTVKNARRENNRVRQQSKKGSQRDKRRRKEYITGANTERTAKQPGSLRGNWKKSKKARKAERKEAQKKRAQEERAQKEKVNDRNDDSSDEI